MTVEPVTRSVMTGSIPARVALCLSCRLVPAGTLHIPLDELEQRWQELESYRDQHIVVYCRTGRRSAAAIELLRSRGFDHLENGGGVAQMAARGLPMEPETCC